MTAQYRAAPSRRRSVRHESQRAALPAHLQSVLLSPLFYACLIWFELTNAYPTEYTTPMYTILRSGEFDAWLSALKDIRGQTRILARIKSAEFGNFGDSEPMGSESPKLPNSADLMRANMRVCPRMSFNALSQASNSPDRRIVYIGVVYSVGYAFVNSNHIRQA